MSRILGGQPQNNTSKILGSISALTIGIGLASSIATMFPQLSEEWKSFLGTMTVNCLFVTGILIILAVRFWCSEQMARIDAFIQECEEMNNALNALTNAGETSRSALQTVCQSHMGNLNAALQTMQAQLEHMEKDMHRKSHFEYNTGAVTRLLEDYVHNHISEITEVHIVCFGRNAYEQAINYIVETCRNITVKVIFCNTEKNKAICLKDDDRKICEQIKKLLVKCTKWNIKIEIFVSDIPPAIRASIVYAGKKGAVWGAIQSYNFVWEGQQLTLVRPEESLIVVGDETCSKKDFNGIISCIEDEFKRLGRSVNKKALINDGKVIFTDAKWGENSNDNDATP